MPLASPRRLLRLQLAVRQCQLRWSATPVTPNLCCQRKRARFHVKVLLLKAFQFRAYEFAPYREDGYGGHMYHGVGSHVLYSDLRHRSYRFAIEIATVDQPGDVHLTASRLRLNVDGNDVIPAQTGLRWHPHHRRETKNSRYSSFQWRQDVEINTRTPCLAEVLIDVQFSDSDQWMTVDGVARVLVDLHPSEPPKYHSKIGWYFRRFIAWWVS